MKIHVLTSKSEINKERIDDKVVVVLDILFATTSIVTAIENGCKEVLVARSSEEALRISKEKKYSNYVLSGELNADTLEGFSHPTPLALLEQNLKNNGLIYCTTNGTVALHDSKAAQHVYAGSLLNGSALTKHIVEKHKNSTVVVVCSGSKDQFNLEDFYGAGQIVDLFKKHNPLANLTDSALAAKHLYNTLDTIDALKASRVGQMMIQRSLDKEIIFTANENTMSAIPKLFKNGSLRDDKC